MRKAMMPARRLVFDAFPVLRAMARASAG